MKDLALRCRWGSIQSLRLGQAGSAGEGVILSDGTVVPIPEPASVLAGLGAVLALAWRLRSTSPRDDFFTLGAARGADGAAPMASSVLIVDDEIDVIDLVKIHLKKAGYQVLTAGNGATALDLARKERPDVIVLDLMLPGMTGIEVCRELRRHPETATLGVVMLTAKGQPSERIAGLEIGADDYVTKPFSPKELVLRVQAVERRTKAAREGTGVIESGDVRIDKGAFEITVAGQRLDLTTTEFKLLTLLVERRGQVQSRDTLLRDVWGYENSIDTRTVDTHIRRLREKLGNRSERIETQRGEGYRFLVEG